MAKVTTVNNGDTGKTARQAWNQAMKTAETDSTITGTGEVATPLGVDTAWLTTFTQNLIDATTENTISTKSYSFKSRSGTSGTNWLAGYYNAATADANLSQASTTVVYGTANSSYAAHAFIVAGGAGSTDGSDLVLTVSGTSITDAGVRTAADSQVVVADCTASSTDQYAETSKKWIGQVTFTLSSTGGATFSFDFNYGISKYEDFGNRDFQVEDFETVGEANANDSSFNVELLKHDGTGWTYSAAAFAPGGTVICSQNTDHNTETDIDSGEGFAYKRVDLATLVDGTGSEGVLIRVTTGTNNSIANMDCHIGVLYTDSLIT